MKRAPAPVARATGAPSPARTRRLAWGFAVLTGAALALLVLGAVVRAKGAGLACPDWPLCFGSVVPAFDVRVALEWSHRVLAGSISLGLAALTLWSLRTPGLRPVLARPLAVIWALLVLQIALGGLTVLLLLAPWTVTAHLAVGTAFCISLLWTAHLLFEAAAPGPVARQRVSPGLRSIVALTCALLVTQLVLGGIVSSHAAGLACASFPSCDGESFAPTLSGQVGLAVLHRLNAAALLAAFAALVFAARYSPRIGRLAWASLHMGILQAGLGVLNVLMRLPVEVTALHSATAALIALGTALIVRETFASRRLPSVPAPGCERAWEVA